MDGYLEDAIKRFRELQDQCDRALAQAPADSWDERLDPGSNSLTTLMLHISGNMFSRWTDFLTTDGEKADRNRDAEFEDADLTRERLLERWRGGWDCLFKALAPLSDADLGRVVLIREQPHTVLQAINRQMTHYAFHAGQMVFLAKHLVGRGWKSQSIPRKGF
jgi:hypothetical protein